MAVIRIFQAIQGYDKAMVRLCTSTACIEHSGLYPLNTSSSVGRIPSMTSCLGPTEDQTACRLCDTTPLSYSIFGVCLDCYGQNVVSFDRTSCRPCPLGLGPANAERTQ